MTKLNEMWAALAAYQLQADATGHGNSWAAMCQMRTTDAAYDASYAAAVGAYAAPEPAEAAWGAAQAIDAAGDACAADADTWAQRVIDHISSTGIGLKVKR